MKNLILVKIVALFTVVMLSQLVSATGAKAATCSRDGDEIKDSNFSLGGDCTVTPDAAMFPIYKLGLCEEVPTLDNYLSDCKFLVEYSTPKEVEVSKDTTIQLNDNITITEGTYKAAVLVVGNTIGLKHVDIFESDQNGNEPDGDEFNVSQGKYCSTRTYTGNQDMFDSADNGVGVEVATLESFLDCAAEPLPAGWYKEDKGAYFSTTLCDDSTGAIVAPAALTTENSSVGKVQICATANDGTTPAQPGVKQVAVQTLPAPVTISANTTSIDVGFELTDMLLIEKHSASGTLGGPISPFTFTNAFVESIGLKITTR